MLAPAPLEDFDGAEFDFQASGAFTLVKSSKTNLQIQTLQQFVKHDPVAVNRSIALRDGGAVVQVNGYADGMTVLVDHRRIRQSVKLRGGGSVAGAGHGLVTSLTVSWPDGTKAELSSGFGLTSIANDQTFRVP